MRHFVIVVLCLSAIPTANGALLVENQTFTGVGDQFRLQTGVIAFSSGTSAPSVVGAGTSAANVYRSMSKSENLTGNSTNQFTWSYFSALLKETEIDAVAAVSSLDPIEVTLVQDLFNAGRTPPDDDVSGVYKVAIPNAQVIDPSYVAANRVVALTRADADVKNLETNTTSFSYTFTKSDASALNWYEFNLDFGVIGATTPKTGLVGGITLSGSGANDLTLVSGGTAGDRFANYDIDFENFTNGESVTFTFDVDMTDLPNGEQGSFALNVESVAIPEPATTVMGCIAGLVLGGAAWRRRKKSV